MILDSPPPIPFQEVATPPSVAWASPAEPAPQCEIRLPRWCIAVFDGQIDVKDSGRHRTWALQSRLYMKDGPLLIVEDKACSGRHDRTVPRQLNRRRVQDSSGKNYVSLVYVIGEAEGCKLEFRIPAPRAELDTSYEQRIRFGILACTEDGCKSTLGASPGV